MIDAAIREILQRGVVIPACPLALTAKREFDERRQRALCRYYAAAGAGGIAVGVHTTQFEIREPKHDLFRPVLALVAEEMRNADKKREEPMVRIGGICGRTPQAVGEAQLLHELGYHAGLVSLTALKDASVDELVTHCIEVAEIIPVVGFYLPPAIGGRVLPFEFWSRFAEIENVVAIKIAPFNRYHTIDVLRAVIEAGRNDIALYTGNDDNIVMDLLTPYRFEARGKKIERRIVGGLLGHWAVWTKKAVELLDECHRIVRSAGPVPLEMVRRSIEVTDANAALYDPQHNFSGCIPGLHEVLRRQGLFENILCLNPKQVLSPGQKDEIDRVYDAYPHLNDDAFVARHLDEWMKG